MKIKFFLIIEYFYILAVFSPNSFFNKKKNEISTNNMSLGLEILDNKKLTMDNYFMYEALKEAKLGQKKGGYPIGSVLVIDNRIAGRGHNQFIQKGSPIIHAEIDAIQNSGINDNDIFKHSTLYTTLSPCQMCSGAILFFKIKRVVIGDNINCNLEQPFVDLLKSNGVEITILNELKCIFILRNFINQNPDLWNKKKGACKNKNNRKKS